MDVIYLSDGLSSEGVMHVLHNAEFSVGQRGHSVYSNYWGLGKQVVDFEDYTNVLLWCDNPCISGFLDKVSWMFVDSFKILFLCLFLFLSFFQLYFIP